MANSASNEIIALPKGGGALYGLGEKFSPDLHTGTGNFTVPIALPAGRNGFQPQLNLVYSTGSGNSPFGLGWKLSIPGVVRKTSQGVPRYNEAAAQTLLDQLKERRDVFILSGAEDLVPVSGAYPGRVRYRPRTEGLFAHITHVRDLTHDYWEVLSKDGFKSWYGTAASLATDPATIADPSDRAKIYAWKLTRTEDPFGNRIEYTYERDRTEQGPHRWDQLYIKQIRYADYDEAGTRRFLVTVSFEYQERRSPTGQDLDPFSEYRSGFEIRTRRRCTQILIHTHTDSDHLVRTYQLVYLDQRPERSHSLPLNGVSLLSQIQATGHDGNEAERLPPLEFDYTRFQPERRHFSPIQGADLPLQSLANPNLELVDLFGTGLPDFVEMNSTIRYWRNLGNGRFDRPRFMKDTPAGLTLADAGVQFIDANGDGRTDLLVTTPVISGYFPLRFDGHWDKNSFQRYRQAPSFNLEDPDVKLVDLDGDGVTDAVRSGTRLECFFNDAKKGWDKTRWVERQALEVFPNVNFSDPRVKWGDFTGDGLQTIALVYDGNVEYWPHFGHGEWGRRIHMENSPRFPFGYDPKRILVGDVDGDGLADIVYVDDSKVTLWINKSGNRWSDPISIVGTPPVVDTDAVRLIDVLGTGISGVLWSRDASGSSRDHLFFFDFTGGVKPYLLHEVDNHIGAVTKVEYAPSSRFYLEDQKGPETRWKTTLPFPVQVVARVEAIDHFSQGKLTTEYQYHHGYWDGAEREFRGFGMVEQRDTETFDRYASPGLHGEDATFTHVDQQHFSPPILSKNWFHQGPVGDEFGDWQELDWSHQYWSGDPQLLKHTETVNQYLQSWLPTPDGRRVKRDALRALRGSILRTELYALDGSDRESRPYTVSESSYGLVEIQAPRVGDLNRLHIFYPHLTSQRTTQWERGNDPMSQFSFTRYTNEREGDAFDPFGRPLAQTQIACPRGWRTMADTPGDPYLATRTCRAYAVPNGADTYIHDRVALVTTYELIATSGETVSDLVMRKDASADLTLIGQTRNFYDGAAFVGLPLGHVGTFGALTRSQNLVLTEAILQDAYGTDRPPYLQSSGNSNWTPDYPLEFRTLCPQRAGYIFHAGSADPADPQGYFVNAARRRYDFQTHPSGTGRGLVVETCDPLHDPAANPSGHRMLITYDDYQMLPMKVTDAAGLVMQATYDYRVLQPTAVTDPNGNSTRLTFSPLGLLESSAIRGREITEGDQSRSSVRMEYDFLAFASSPPTHRQPIAVRTIRHIHHDTELDVPLPERDETITTVEYSDGFGRLLQTRTQGEEVRLGNEHFGGGEAVLPAKQIDGAGGDVVGQPNTDVSKPNVIVNGWQVYDNKGQVVEKYEPFFSERWEYNQPDDRKRGQKMLMFYDPRGQAIRTLNPDGSEQRVIYGVPGTIAIPDVEHPEVFEPTPWEAYTYDANDNAGRTHATMSLSYRHHWNTPTNVLVDALGRTIKAVERNREAPANRADPLLPIQELVTRTTYDIRGNVLTIIDALGRKAFTHVYDFANRRLRLDSIDAGRRKTVFDAVGTVIEQRDSKGAFTLHSYDSLNRSVRLWARDSQNQQLTLREHVEYGDGGDPAQPMSDRAIHRATNRLGKPFRHFDEAGFLTFDRYDFKGNLVEKTRRTISDSLLLAVFSPPPPGWEVDAFRVNWSNPGSVMLDAQAYTTTISYDALNRIKQLTYPHDVENQRQTLTPRYNQSGALESVTLEKTVAGGSSVRTMYVERIAYNAKGRRVLLAYGNGIMTRYAYDPQTFRLVRLRTERFNQPAELTYHHTGQPLQEFGYDYDLVGNVVSFHDRTPDSGINGSVEGVDMLDRIFSYDALYRLLSATGRECDKAPELPWDHSPRPTDLTKTRGYTERYRYDLTGNLTELAHVVSGATMTRDFALMAGNNRLSMVTIGAAGFGCQYDANGNMTAETTSRHFDWDWADRMKVFRTQTTNSEPSVHVQYLYDAGGQRVKKLVRKPGGHVEVTVYIDGSFEYERIVRAGTVEQNNTLHVMDNQSRVALVRVGQPFTNDATPAVKYHLGDHLGSSNLVVDDAGNVINREEYTPYGETSFGSFARKRYRFTGKERDEESGLNYHGARYYAPWLGRWTSCDPAGFQDGINVYLFVRASPLRLVDRNGKDGTPPPDGDAGAPLQQPTPDFVDPGGQAIFVMTDEQRQAQKAELPEGGALPPEQARKGLVPTTGGTKVKNYIEQERTVGLKAAARNNPLVVSTVVIAAVVVSPIDKKKGQKIADSITGPEPKSEVAQGAELYGGVALSLGETLVGGGIAGVRLRLRMPKPRGLGGTLGRPRAPKLTVSSAEVEEALKEAAAEATTTLYHFGDLEGGVLPGKNFSTTPDPEYANEFVRIHGGRINRLEIPTARLKELEQVGAVERLTDSIKGTTISGPEVRFKGSHMNENLAKEINTYKAP